MADTGEPQYKASMSQALLDRMRSVLTAEQFEAVLGKVPSTTIDAIESASRTAWLAAERQLELDAAMLEVLGEQGLIDFNRAYAAHAAEVPVFAPIARGALALFGGVKGALKFLPKTWGFIARNCGECSYEEIGPQHGRIRYSGLPELLRRPSFPLTTEGTMWGIIDFAKAKGAQITRDHSVTLEDGIVQFDARWSE